MRQRTLRQRTQAIKARLTVPAVARRLGLHLVRQQGGEWLSCPRPAHHDKTPSCWLHDDHWWCFGCCIGGSMIDLVMEVKSKGIIDAVDWLEKAYGLGRQRGPEALKLRIETARQAQPKEESLPVGLLDKFEAVLVDDVRWYGCVPIPSVGEHLTSILDYVYAELDDLIRRVEGGQAGVSDLERFAVWAKGLCSTRYSIMMGSMTMVRPSKTKGDTDGRTLEARKGQAGKGRGKGRG